MTLPRTRRPASPRATRSSSTRHPPPPCPAATCPRTPTTTPSHRRRPCHHPAGVRSTGGIVAGLRRHVRAAAGARVRWPEAVERGQERHHDGARHGHDDRVPDILQAGRASGDERVRVHLLDGDEARLRRVPRLISNCDLFLGFGGLFILAGTFWLVLFGWLFLFYFISFLFVVIAMAGWDGVRAGGGRLERQVNIAMQCVRIPHAARPPVRPPTRPAPRTPAISTSQPLVSAGPRPKCTFGPTQPPA